jgi:acyl-CoA hydrolase
VTGSSGLMRLLRSGDRILVASGAGEPSTLVTDLLDAVTRTNLRVEIVQVQTGGSGRLLEAAQHGQHVVLPVPARGELPPGVEVLPASMFQIARAMADGSYRVDGVLFSGVAADHTEVQPGICTDLVPAAFERARFRAVELTDSFPRLAGETLPLERCDLVVPSQGGPAVMEPPVASAAALAIGHHVAELVHDGVALEVGVGQSLAGVAGALIAGGVEVSVHTGLASDWTQDLVDRGAACRPLACAGGAPVIATAAMGSAAFYQWLDGHPAVRMVESRHAHDPAHLARLGTFVAVNAASRVDLAGQVGVPAEARDRRAVGGLLDFATGGAYGGHSVIAVLAVDRHGRSQIVPRLSEVQLPAQLVTHVVTEFGIARLAGRTWRQRRREMVSVAHPDHRAALRAAAEQA